MFHLEMFRSQKDKFLRTHPQNPLTLEQRHAFVGLRYFPENPARRCEVTGEPCASHDLIVMHTSAGEQRTYVRYGRFQFIVDDQDVALTIYADAQGSSCRL